MHATFNYPVFSVRQSCSSEDGLQVFSRFHPAIPRAFPSRGVFYLVARRSDPDGGKVRWMSGRVVSPSHAPFFLVCFPLRLPQMNKFKRLIVNNSTVIHISL